MSTGSAPGNVVLVHGAFVDGSGWRAVYDLLHAVELGCPLAARPPAPSPYVTGSKVVPSPRRRGSRTGC